MIPICGFIFDQERVALCELVVKDDLFQLVEVFVPGFWSILLDTQQICEHILSLQIPVVVCLKFIFNGNTWRARYYIYLFIYLCILHSSVFKQS